MPWVAAGIAVGGSLLSSSMAPEDKSWKAEIDKQGVNEAAVMMQTARNWEALPAKARALASQAELEKVQIEKQAAASKADAAVQAAAAGVTGASVDAVASSIDANAANAVSSINKQKAAGEAQLKQDYADIFWEGDAARYEYKYSGGKGPGLFAQLGTAALAGAGAYYQARS